MTKSDLVKEVAKSAGLTLSKVTNAVNAFIEAIKENLSKEENITLTDFGSFSGLKRKARTEVNPKTDETMKIFAKKVTKFTAGQHLKGIDFKALTVLSSERLKSV